MKKQQKKEVSTGTNVLAKGLSIYKRYRVVVISGVSEFTALTLSQSGKLLKQTRGRNKDAFSELNAAIKGQRILKFEVGNSPASELGFTMLTDNGDYMSHYD